MTDIRTKSGREELRRDHLKGYEAWGADPDQSVMIRALDGLNIAQEMAEWSAYWDAARGHYTCKICGKCWDNDESQFHADDCPVKRWLIWKQEGRIS